MRKSIIPKVRVEQNENPFKQKMRIIDVTTPADDRMWGQGGHACSQRQDAGLWNQNFSRPLIVLFSLSQICLQGWQSSLVEYVSNCLSSDVVFVFVLTFGRRVHVVVNRVACLLSLLCYKIKYLILFNRDGCKYNI